MKKFLFLISFIVVVTISFFQCCENHESYSIKSEEFIINKPFIIVVKGLAKKDSLEKMVEENDGIVSNKYWERFDVAVPQRILRIRDYEIDSTLKFKVIKKDGDLGELTLPFVQNMHLSKNELFINTSLIESTSSVVSYDKIIEITPIDEEKTQIKIKNEIKVKKYIPFFLKDMMNKRVEICNEKDLENMKENIFSISGPPVRVIRK